MGIRYGVGIYLDIYKYMGYGWRTTMKSKTRSILSELENISKYYDQKQLIETQARNSIASISNLLILIRETYSEEIANDLEKRLFNSIKSGDENKFVKGVRRANQTTQKQQ